MTLVLSIIPIKKLIVWLPVQKHLLFHVTYSVEKFPFILHDWVMCHYLVLQSSPYATQARGLKVRQNLALTILQLLITSTSQKLIVVGAFIRCVHVLGDGLKAL